MAAKTEKMVQEGVVIESLPDAVFRVQLENESVVVAYISGKMRRHHIRILVGDRVRVEIPPEDPQRGRIVYRYKK